MIVAEAASPTLRRGPVGPGTELASGYRVIGHLNRGNRLDVYDAWSDERQSRCVLKTLRPDRAGEAPARRALLREGRLLLRLSHPHLVRAYELTRALDDGRPVLVLETLGGETLSHLIHRLDEGGRRLPLADVARLGIQLASVIGYIHRQGWLHLDLKPSNIIAEAGRARLIDLSVIRRPGRARAGTGTFEYMAPEQARGGLLSAAADVWGLGAVLYGALVGEPPYGYPGMQADEDEGEGTWATDPTTVLDTRSEYPQLMADPLSVRRRRRVPALMAGLVDRCLDREPAARPSLAEIVTSLEAMLASHPDGRARQ